MSTVKLPVNAADFPKSTAVRIAMTDIAQRYIDRYEKELNGLSPADKLQRKVLHMQKHMAEHCHCFAAMGYNSSLWEEQIARREAMLNREGILADYAAALSALSADERGAFIQYAHTNWFLHNAFLDQHIRKAETAVQNGHPENAFSDRIILGTVYAICREWRQWWLANGTLPFDRWTYEDTPYEAEEMP